MLQIAVVREKPDAAVQNGHEPVGPVFVQFKFDELIVQRTLKVQVRAFVDRNKQRATEPTPRMLPSSMPLKRSSKS